MDPVTIVDQTLISLGYGVYVPVVLAAVGFFSAVATVYPNTWKGAGTIHKMALLLKNASPATPAVAPATTVVNTGVILPPKV